MIQKKIYSYLLIFAFLFLPGFYYGNKIDFNPMLQRGAVAEDLALDDQEASVRAIKGALPSVVNIVTSDEKDIKVFNPDTGEISVEKQKVVEGTGTGFIISSDGLIITNKHVIQAGKNGSSDYQILLSTGKQYFAQLIGTDPLNDLAILKIFDKNLPFVEIGDSSNLELGQTVIAIGNALGRYQNTVTKGIVSGLGRHISAADSRGRVDPLDNLVQTDAGINQGNSGGPLIDLHGRVVGINVAIDTAGAGIGFAIPINDARPVINSVREVGRIIRPQLGVRYQMIDSEIYTKNQLSRDAGALLVDGPNGEPAVIPNSPAFEGGLASGDIIFEINAIKIEGANTLQSVIQRYKPGNKIGMKIQRDSKIIIREVELGEFK